jgi:hypothetical protein
MRSKLVTALGVVLTVAVWEFAVRPCLVSPVVAQSDQPKAKDNEELARMYAEDQADRAPKDGKPIDWGVVGPRDKQRLKTMRELYNDGKLATAADYYHAAMLLQHSNTASDYLLAHELCVVAVAKGESRAKWLAAATEDRFLNKIGRPQRFGTQYRQDAPDPLLHLSPVEDGVTDRLRREYNAPTLDEAKALEAKLNEKLGKSK